MLSFRPGIFRLTLFLVFLAVTPVYAQARHSIHRAPTDEPSPSDAIVNELRHMQGDGISDDVMIDYIKSKHQAYDLTASQLIRLKDGGVDDGVIKVLLGAPQLPAAPQSQPVRAVTPSSATTAPTESAANAMRPAAAQKVEPELPAEIGVYAKRQDQWIEVLPEIVNWKSGGVVKTLATAFVVKEDINGHIQGTKGRIACSGSTEFLIIVPDGTAITEYQLLKLHVNSNNREFRTVTGGVFHFSGGAMRDMHSFESSKISARTYLVKLPGSLPPGEYGFLPPGAYTTGNLGASGKINTFTIVE
jgi:hypothetical protein